MTMLPFWKSDSASVFCGDCASVLAEMPGELFDLTVTSPPYDNLREYDGYTFPFEAIAQQLFRVTKNGGVVVWIVGDATVNGSETGTSFKQALFFKELGFNLHDTMIWEKASRIPTQDRYYSVAEYMFVLSKGKPKTLNFLCDHKNTTVGQSRRKDKVINKGKNEKWDNKFTVTPEYSRRSNIWRYGTAGNGTPHPAIFPESLARDHVLSWSREGDVVLDPMCGSGTTLRASLLAKRICVGVDISRNYCALSAVRCIQTLQELGE